MPCSICGSSVHNKRTCSSKSGATPLEIRVAKELSSLLPPVVKRVRVRAGKPLEGLQGCMNIFKETKITPPPPTRVHICSKCGVRGHNSRTCELTHLKETTKSSLNQRRCGMCGQYGHNRRSCEDISKSPIQVKSKKTCSVCGEKGHNSRSCLLRCKPCEENSLPRVSEKITFADGVTRQIDLGIA